MDKPIIEPTINGPNRVRNLKRFNNSKGETIEARPEMYLCRCGGSSNKPFCDGTHMNIGFKSGKSLDRVPDRLDSVQIIHQLSSRAGKSRGLTLMQMMPIEQLQRLLCVLQVL